MCPLVVPSSLVTVADDCFCVRSRACESRAPKNNKRLGGKSPQRKRSMTTSSATRASGLVVCYNCCISHCPSVRLSICLPVCVRARAGDRLPHADSPVPLLPFPIRHPSLPPHHDFTTTAPLLYSAICAFPLKGELPRRKLRFSLILNAYAAINTCQL